MTIPDQIQATRDTYGRQMAQPPGKTLFYGTLSHDAIGPAGVTMYPHRHFTDAHLAEYHPLRSMFDIHTKQRVIQAHHNLKHLFSLYQPNPHYTGIGNYSQRQGKSTRYLISSHTFVEYLVQPDTMDSL